MKKDSNSVFKTIRQVAKTGLLPENALRHLLKQGELPGLYCGSRYYINTVQLKRQLKIIDE